MASSSQAVTFKATLEPVDSLPLFQEVAPNAQAVKQLPNADQTEDFLLTLDANVPLQDFPWLQAVSNESVEFLVVLDQSSSMNGHPWKQVQDAVARMLHLTAGNEKIKLRFMVYNQVASWLGLTEGDAAAAEAQIRAVNSCGSTNFAAVFEMLSNYFDTGKITYEQKPASNMQSRQTYLQQLKNMTFPGSTSSAANPPEMKQGEEVRTKKQKVFVFFMTDGCDTCNTLAVTSAQKNKLQAAIARYGEEVVVNVLGFGSNHNDDFLESLSLVGTSDGSYSFVAESEGESALDERLTALIASTTGLIGKSVFLELTHASTVGGGFLGEWFGAVKDRVVLQAFMHVDGKDNTATVKTAKFMRLPKGEQFKLSIAMMRDLQDSGEGQDVPCTVGQVAQIVGTNDKLRLLKLRTGLNMITARMANLADDKVPLDAPAMLDVKAWYTALKACAEMLDLNAALKSEDKQLSKLADFVRAGLEMCEETLNPNPEASYEHVQKQMRGGQTKWNIKSGQSHNLMQKKKKAGGHARAARQERQECNDIY